MKKDSDTMNTIIFDLDGTLSDSAEGIVKSINYALKKLGCDEQPPEDLLDCIGPPLNFSFARLTGRKNEEYLLKAVKAFRERYFEKGYMENTLYDGIKDILTGLKEEGNILCIATTKRKDIAEEVLKYFKIDGFFTQVHGGDIYRKKADLLRDIINDPDLGNNPLIMIGDRNTDFEAASEVNMPSIAVRWGYGNEDELRLATCIAESPPELPGLIYKNARRIKKEE